jgi:chromosome partitioning protein
MILTVGNTKCGTGKTTLAVQLAISLARSGRDVLLVDGDTQGSAQDTIAVRTDAGRRPLWRALSMPMAASCAIRCGIRPRSMTT